MDDTTFAVRAAVRAVDRAMRTHGAMGFTNELGLAEAYHVLRVFNVADGTNEILNRTIFQRLAGGDVALSVNRLDRRQRPGDDPRIGVPE